MDSERIAELRRDLDEDVILNREDIRELMDDAERYLYLRSGFNDVLPVCDESGEWVYGEKLDAAIDAAVKGGE